MVPDPTAPRVRAQQRPFAFFVSTTGCARSISMNLGSPAYSYVFALEGLAPVLEEFGVWQLLERPESRLPFLAAKATAEGFRPVHLSMNPPQDGYFTPAVPTIVYPFWEFPRIPDRDFGYDTRQNWARMCRPASLVLTSCRFTAEAIGRSDIRCPVAVVPIPLDPDYFSLPPWRRDQSWTLTCRHTVLSPEECGDEQARASVSDEGPPTRKRRVWQFAKRGFHVVYPWLDPKSVEKISRVKTALLFTARQSPLKLAYLGVRAGYRRTVRRWLSLAALEKITTAKNKALALAGRSPATVIDPLLPRAPIRLEGLTYTSILNLGDLRKNYMDMLSAFLIAFRERSDVTLVIKLATSPHREHHEVGILRKQYQSLGLNHACRVVVITEFLDSDAMRGLMQATTYYVNTSHSEGACLPLQQALAGGRPGIAPDHTAMADYMDSDVGFVPRSDPEPAFWPHDPDMRLETERYRLVWTDIRDCFLASANVVDREPRRYQALAENATRKMAAYASRSVSAEALRMALTLLPESELGALTWAS
jgi:glycosyltransferase involved in cell wall biosynthesis